MCSIMGYCGSNADLDIFKKGLFIENPIFVLLLKKVLTGRLQEVRTTAVS